MIWADRVAVVWAGIVYGLYWLGALTADAATWPFFAFFVLGPWLVLRGLSWIVTSGRKYSA